MMSDIDEVKSMMPYMILLIVIGGAYGILVEHCYTYNLELQKTPDNFVCDILTGKDGTNNRPVNYPLGDAWPYNVKFNQPTNPNG